MSEHYAEPESARRVHGAAQWLKGERPRAEGEGLRVAWVTPCVLLGGVETVVRGLCERLPASWGMDVLTWRADPDALEALLGVVDGLWVSGVGERFPGGLEGNEPLAERLAGVLWRGEYDVVIGTNTAVTYEVAQGVSKALRVEYLHGGLGWHQVAKPAVERVLAVSSWCLESAREVRVGLEGEVVFNGVDAAQWQHQGERVRCRRELGLEAGAQVVAYVGRVSSEKGVDVLAEAARGQQWTLLVCGKAYDLAYGERVRELLGENAVWLAHGLKGADVWKAYQAADVVASPSRHEAFGLAGLEALASGRAVVATKAGGLQEALEGWARYVEVEDVEGLQEAVGEELEQRRDMGEAVEWVRKERTLEVQAARVRELLESWVSMR